MLPFKFKSGVVLRASRIPPRASSSTKESVQDTQAQIDLIRAKTQQQAKQAELGKFNHKMTALDQKISTISKSRKSLEEKVKEEVERVQKEGEERLSKHDEQAHALAQRMSQASSRREALNEEIHEARQKVGTILFEKVKPVSVQPMASTPHHHAPPSLL